MKILYCSWWENSDFDTLNSLKKIAAEVKMVQREVKEYLDGRALPAIVEQLTDDVDIVFSYDFLPLVSKLCKIKKKRYISWIYDWPNYTVYDPEIYNSCNEIYLFERDGISMLENRGVKNLYYMPLAVDVQRLDEQLGTDFDDLSYEYDVSFVGSLYSNREQAMLTDKVPEYYSGFVDALAEMQEKIYGYNLVNDIIDEKFTERYLQETGVSLDGMYVPKEYVLAAQINRLVTGRERQKLLSAAAEKNEVHLFTASKPEGLSGVVIHDAVDYRTKMPDIFRKTKINLNITLRSITSGVPLRVFDILGAGGFCLTNYQDGIREHFEDGKDLVVFTDREDMMEKIQYYLSHEEERKKIAMQGHESVKKYGYLNAFEKMFMRHFVFSA